MWLPRTQCLGRWEVCGVGCVGGWGAWGVAGGMGSRVHGGWWRVWEGGVQGGGPQRPVAVPAPHTGSLVLSSSVAQCLWRALTTSPPPQAVNFQQIIKGPGTTAISLSFHEPQPSSLQQNVGITAWGSRACPSVLSLSPEGNGCSFSLLLLHAFESPFLLN